MGGVAVESPPRLGSAPLGKLPIELPTKKRSRASGRGSVKSGLMRGGMPPVQRVRVIDLRKHSLHGTTAPSRAVTDTTKNREAQRERGVAAFISRTTSDSLLRSASFNGCARTGRTRGLTEMIIADQSHERTEASVALRFLSGYSPMVTPGGLLVNMIPFASSARWIASAVRGMSASPRSNFVSVEFETRASAASSLTPS